MSEGRSRLDTEAGGALAAALALLLAWPLWLHRLGINDYDDGVSNEVIFARSPLSKILFELRWEDQSPLYFVLLHFWTWLGRDPFTVKLLNVLLLSAVPLLVWQIARRTAAGPRVAGLALAIAVLSPMTLWMVRNGRMYVPQLVLSLWSVAALLAVLERGRRRDVFALVIACALNIYNHFFGFLISAIVFAVWLLESVLARGAARRSVWRGPLLAGLALALLVTPQLLRALALGDRPPGQASWSLPGASVRSMEHVQAFWLVNAPWSGLRDTLPFADELFYVSAYGLAILGLAAAPPRAARLTLVWFAAPLLLFGVLAETLDLRARYLGFVAPLLWLSIARGALAPLTPAWTRRLGRWARPLRPVRMGLFAVFAFGTLWLLWHKLPERYAEWSKVLAALDRVYRPEMPVYMEGGTARGIPPAVVAHSGLHPGIGKLRLLRSEPDPLFANEMTRHPGFVFLIHLGRIGEGQRWMHEVLEEQGFHPVRIPAWNAEARLFTREPIARFALRYRVPESERAAWIAARLADPQRAPAPDSALQAALVARIDGDGRLRESVVYASQRGERGAWYLGDADGSAVVDAEARLEGERRRAWRVRVPAGQTALLALAREDAGDPTRWRFGAPPPDEAEPATLHLIVRAGDRTLGGFEGVAPTGWTALELDGAAMGTASGPLALELAHDGAQTLDVYLAR